MSIAKKIILGYLPLTIVVMLISLTALYNLEQINNINEEIITKDAPLIEATDELLDDLLTQESYGRRYIILKTPEMLELFWKRSEEFKRTAKEIASLRPDDEKIDSILKIHDEYNRLFVKGFEHLGENSSPLADRYERDIKNKQKELVSLIKGLSTEARISQKGKTIKSARIGERSFQLTAILALIGIILGISAAVLITNNISGSIRKLKHATKEISEGNFDYSPDISNKDELGELANAFMEMGKRLKRLEEMYLDTNPLTRLPGVVAIENVLKKRLELKVPLAFCLVDMDNFKSFSDRYGYARGSKVIKETGRIVEDAVARHGGEDDFVGHIGGDDFVVITTPERYAEICRAIIESFDRKIPEFYDKEDRERGYIISKNRQGKIMSFPITTISIAVITNTMRELTNPVEIGELAAELKEYAKSLHGSIYVVDKRRDRVLSSGYICKENKC